MEPFSANSREIITAIVRDKVCPERMGFQEAFWQDTRREWENQGLPCDKSLHELFGLDILEIPGNMFDTSPFPGTRRIVDEDEETVTYRNGWGAVLREWKADRPGVPEHIDFELTSPRIWREKYREPLLGLDLNRFENVEDLKRSYRKGMESDLFCVYHNIHVYELMRTALGDIVMLESMCAEPEWIHDFCGVITDNIIRHLSWALDNIGRPDGVWFYDDLGYCQASFVSPELYRNLIFPYHKRVFDVVHDYGLPVIFHSCGRIRPLFEAIVETGIDCLQAIEVKAGQDVLEMAESAKNRIAFMGNMDIRIFETNDLAAVDAAFIPRLNQIRDKRIPYIFHSDHSIPKSVRLETYKHVRRMFLSHCRY
ncbi:MAG: uroporphyrinogen decarboxylase family protein [Acidobacteria bacterium]|nr:uroporphyrinogen decarboxylase family protein [Acidobacteriota bacterium]